MAPAMSDPSGFVAGLESQVTLDEVQHVPEVFPVIKATIDRKRQPGQFLLTGSAYTPVVKSFPLAEIFTVFRPVGFG